MKVILAPIVDLKLRYYVELNDEEVSGLGLVEKRGENTLYVTDVFLLKQTVTGVETKLHREDVRNFIYEKLDIPDFPTEKIRLWWHSHVDMATFWSGTDTGTIDGLDLDEETDNWWLSIVCNKQGNRRARVDVYKPFRLVADELDVVTNEDLDLKEQIKKEVAEKVSSAPKPTTPIYGAQGQVLNGKNFSSDQDDDREYSLAGGSNGYNHQSKKNKKKHKKYWNN